jgi:hypothetical protein
MPLDSTVLGVDIMPIKPIRGVQTFIEDITTAKCRATVKKAANGKLMDVILHDGAPNVGGVFSKEMYNQVRSLSQPDSALALGQTRCQSLWRLGPGLRSPVSDRSSHVVEVVELEVETLNFKGQTPRL